LALPASAAAPSLNTPNWVDLNPQQKVILAPLAGEWNRMEPYRRQKWLGIAKRFPTMTPDEQARVQERMLVWVKLSPDERKAARDKYKDIKKAGPEKQAVLKERWREYENLPDDEKKRLKAKPAARKPKVERPPPGGAPYRPSIPKPESKDGSVLLAPALPPPKPVRP